jgi:RES domain-containing protein
MLTAWRIVRRPRAADAFTGEGARSYGGRWNSPGVPVVFCSSSRALAALETLVHINPQIPLDYVIISATFEAVLLETYPESKLPSGWDAEPPGPASMAVGDAWAKEARSAAFGVPSRITGELNYVLNVAHKDFAHVRIAKAEPFSFDRRLLKRT